MWLLLNNLSAFKVKIPEMLFSLTETKGGKCAVIAVKRFGQVATCARSDFAKTTIRKEEHIS